MGRQVISAREVEETAASGRTDLVVGGGALVTPLAVDRAGELGLRLVREDGGAGFCPSRQLTPGADGGEGRGRGRQFPALERRVRLVAQRLILEGWREAFCPKTVDLVARRVIGLLQEKNERGVIK